MEWDRTGYPTYGQTNDLGALPKYIQLSWANATQKGAGDSQYQTWHWKMPKTVEGYRYASVLGVDFQASNFSTVPRMIGLRIDEMGTTSFGCDTPSPRIMPTWMIPNLLSPLLQYNDHSKDQYLTLIQGETLSDVTFSWCDESFSPVAVVGAPPGGFYFELYLKFWK